MFISRLYSSDSRFREITFKEGLNILVADRTEISVLGDSRNGTGKTSVVRILRYILGGSLPDEFKSNSLSEHSFTAVLNLPSADTGGEEQVIVSRPITPTTRVAVSGWSATDGEVDLSIETWRSLLSVNVFNLSRDCPRPTLGQLWGQLIRTHYGKPTKGHATETDWESGVKLGFLLGLEPRVLFKAGELSNLIKQQKAIRNVIREGAIKHLSLDEADLRSQLATARRQRDRVREELRAFKVNEQYAEQIREADELSATIRALNDEEVRLRRRERDLNSTLTIEIDSTIRDDFAISLQRIYSEVGLLLPDVVSRRFEEVSNFHQSVVRNRQSFLVNELNEVSRRIGEVSQERTSLDERRASIMQLLNDSVALQTFLDAQQSLAQLESASSDLERRLDSTLAIKEVNNKIKIQTAETVASVSSEMKERTASLEEPIALFNDLGREIYVDKEANLLISTSPKGILTIKPSVAGDASDGIRSVETFLLDMVMVVSAVKNHRAPGLLVHDSHLFDSIDSRQVASCLNIGARLSDEYNFQYLVTMNSDFLDSVVIQSDNAFIPTPYELDTRFTDSREDGGLFGFRFE